MLLAGGMNENTMALLVCYILGIDVGGCFSNKLWLPRASAPGVWVVVECG